MLAWCFPIKAHLKLLNQVNLILRIQAYLICLNQAYTGIFQLIRAFYTWYLVLSAPFEKFVRVVFLVPLTGIQYSEKVIERIGVQAYTTKVQEEHKQKKLCQV